MAWININDELPVKKRNRETWVLAINKNYSFTCLDLFEVNDESRKKIKELATHWKYIDID